MLMFVNSNLSHSHHVVDAGKLNCSVVEITWVEIANRNKKCVIDSNNQLVVPDALRK